MMKKYIPGCLAILLTVNTRVQGDYIISDSSALHGKAYVSGGIRKGYSFHGVFLERLSQGDTSLYYCCLR